MSGKHVAIATFAVLVGSFAGWLTPRVDPAKAVPYSYYVWVHPGGTTSGSDDYLTCGYHSKCLPPVNSGTGLDWVNTHGENVFYRSNSSNSAGYSWAGTGLITREYIGQCRTVYVFQYRRSGASDSAVKYQHTGTNYQGTQFTISSDYYPAWTSLVVGQTMTEPSSCDTTGDHLHQQTYVGGNHWKNTHYPEMSACSSGCGNYNVMTNYQLGYYWSE